jgi:hypothetical protein
MSVVKCKATNVAPRVSALRRAPSILQCLRNPVEPLIDVSDLVLQGFHLRPRCRVQDTGRRSASRALNHRELYPSPSAVNNASSKLWPLHFMQVETAISALLPFSIASTTYSGGDFLGNWIGARLNHRLRRSFGVRRRDRRQAARMARFTS